MLRALGPPSKRPIEPPLLLGHFGEFVQGRVGAGGPVAVITAPGPFTAWAEIDGAALALGRRGDPGRAAAGTGAGTGAATPTGTATGARTGARKGARTAVEIDRVARRRGVLDDPLARRAADAAAAAIGAPAPWAVWVATDAPEGAGAGSSTLKALAAVRAVARAAGAQLTPDEETAIALGVEGATDPLAFPLDPPRLWASRAGVTLETFAPCPPLRVVGAFDGPGARTDPADDAFPDVSDAIALFREGCAARDPRRIGAAATLSATRNQARNPKPHWSAMCALADQLGALGLLVAHTGAAIGLILPRIDAEAPPAAPDPDALAETARSRIAALGLGEVVVCDIGVAADRLARPKSAV